MATTNGLAKAGKEVILEAQTECKGETEMEVMQQERDG